MKTGRVEPSLNNDFLVQMKPDLFIKAGSSTQPESIVARMIHIEQTAAEHLTPVDDAFDANDLAVELGVMLNNLSDRQRLPLWSGRRDSEKEKRRKNLQSDATNSR